jgi:hypothetical protein
VHRYFVLGVLVLAALPYHSSVKPVPASMRSELRAHGFYARGCPVGLSQLRLLTVTYHDFAGRSQTGQLIVNRQFAHPLARVFRRLYALHFPIHHMEFTDVYGTKKQQPRDNDASGSFECREAVPSPCSGGSGTGSWSEHAFGRAVDINPVENPYVGCGMSRDPRSKPYFNRSIHRRGMVTRKVRAAFASIGWGWGGSWVGNTKDYMHFSASGH